MVEKIKNWRQKLGKWFWVILILLIVVGWRVFVASTKTVKVQTIKLSSGNIVQTVSTSGTVRADQYSALTFAAGGKILYVNVKPGDKVVKGQAIAGIDTVVLNVAYQNALNTYRATQAAVDLEHDNDKNYGSAETFSQRSTRTAAEVANDNAYNNYLAASDNLKNANIYAPFNGIMDTVNPSSPGMTVVAATANYTIVNPDTVYFDSEVEETDLPNILPGQKVNIKLDAYPNENFEGLVTNIGFVAFTSSTGGNAYHVRISLPKNTNTKFRVGMQGDADIIFNTVSGVEKVASSAVISDGNKYYVWVVESGKAKKIEVDAGATSSDETEIKSGLNLNSIIIDNPANSLKNGERVSI